MLNPLKTLFCILASILFFFVALFGYTKLAGPIPFDINSVSTNKTDSFSVTGEGKASIAPDSAAIRVGVVSSGATTKAAQDDLNTNINKVTEAVKAQGVDSKDIKTENYNINPTYDYTAGSQKITGYSANTNVNITVRKIDKANAILDAATAAGANQVGGITFSNSDQSNAEDEARQKAVADAKKKAQQAASIAGFTLGKLINYQENNSGAPRPVPYAMDSLKAAGGGVPTQVEPGSNEVTIDVTLSYEVR